MRPARSVLGSCSGRVNIGEDDILIALRAYFDSSGKLHNNWITLAAIASTDSVWSEIENVWHHTLESHTPKTSYIHMKEIYRLEDAFDKALGWTHDSAFGLVNECLTPVSLVPKDQIHMFFCSIDLVAMQKLRDETYQIPDPIDMCNMFCSEFILTWYALYYPQVMDPKTDSVKYFFDRNEYFFQPFYEKWNRERNISEATGRWSIWNAIEEVAPVEMRKIPGIQLADIIAWSRNRETFAKEGDLAKYMATMLRKIIPSSYVIWDEAKMREQYKPLIYRP